MYPGFLSSALDFGLKSTDFLSLPKFFYTGVSSFWAMHVSQESFVAKSSIPDTKQGDSEFMPHHHDTAWKQNSGSPTLGAKECLSDPKPREIKISNLREMSFVQTQSASNAFLLKLCS